MFLYRAKVAHFGEKLGYWLPWVVQKRSKLVNFPRLLGLESTQDVLCQILRA